LKTFHKDRCSITNTDDNGCNELSSGDNVNIAGNEEVKIVTLNKENLNSTRELLPFLKDR
jgi:CRISPR/Cas system CMR-associated protein Cmr3 (group 5 of RAMP superfamily)